MKTTRTLTSLLIIAVGPFATIYLCAAVNTGSKNESEMFSLIVSVLILSAVTATVSTAAHSVLKHPLLATAVSVLISEILYVVLLFTYIYCMSEGLERSESLVWLPIMILFLIPFGFPTALSVSYGAGRIVRDFREGVNNGSRDFVKHLIE